MSHRILPFALITALLAGCHAPGTAGAPPAGSRAAGSLAAASAQAFGTAAIAAFDQKPSLGLTKRPTPLRTALFALPAAELPASLIKIQGFAATGLAEADKKDNWNERWGCTDGALVKIDAVKLSGHGLNNVPAKLGYLAARGYGYMGLHPTHENRYKVQAVTLGFLSQAGQETLLAKGAPIFTLSAEMLEVTTGWDQGFRVGISVLTALKENYKDRETSKTCQAILDKSVGAPSKEEAYATMVSGLRDLSKKVAR